MTPPDLGSYRVRHVLADGRTFACDGPDGRPVVLKRLPDDCLYGDGLHPAVRDRLARVREVPHPAVSQLRGVDRLPAGTFAVWDDVPGTTWDEATVTTAVAVAAVRAVEALHARGLVHGAIHPRNLVLTPAGNVWLLHPSPYLYTDPAADVAGLLATVRPRFPSDRADPTTLAELLDRLARPAVDRDSTPARWPAAAAAAIVAVAAVAAGVLVHHRVVTRPAAVPAGEIDGRR